MNAEVSRSRKLQRSKFDVGRSAFSLNGQIVAGAGNRESSVFHAFGGDERVSEFFHRGYATAHDDDFQAVVVIEMDVERGDDALAVIVLQIGERFLQMAFVMIENERDCARDFVVAVMLMMLDEMIADHVGERLRTVVVTFLFRHRIEIAQQFFWQRGAEACGVLIFLICAFHITNLFDRNTRGFYVKHQRTKFQTSKIEDCYCDSGQ